MNDSIFGDFNISFKNKVHTFVFMLELIKLLFSCFLFFLICFAYLSKRQRYLDRRNINPQHRNYFIVNCTYISVILFFATLFSLFSYYFPKITLIYIFIQSRNFI